MTAHWLQTPVPPRFLDNMQMWGPAEETNLNRLCARFATRAQRAKSDVVLQHLVQHLRDSFEDLGTPTAAARRNTRVFVARVTQHRLSAAQLDALWNAHPPAHTTFSATMRRLMKCLW